MSVRARVCLQDLQVSREIFLTKGRLIKLYFITFIKMPGFTFSSPKMT